MAASCLQQTTTIGACVAESRTWLPDKIKVQKDVEARDAIRKQKVRGNFRVVVEREDVRLATGDLAGCLDRDLF